jgi:hypothetical protein
VKIHETRTLQDFEDFVKDKKDLLTKHAANGIVNSSTDLALLLWQNARQLPITFLDAKNVIEKHIAPLSFKNEH